MLRGEPLGIATRAAVFDSLTATERQLRARLELATRLGALAADARDLAELFRALYDETARIMDATVFLFGLYDEASATVQVVRQMDRGVEHSGGTFPLGKGFTSEVIRTGTPRLVRRWSAGPPPLRDRGGRAGRTPVGRRGPDPIRRSGARCALRAELSTRSLRRCGCPQPRRHRRASGHHRQTSAPRTTRSAAGSRPRDHERRPPHR